MAENGPGGPPACLDWARSLAIVDEDVDLLAHLLRVFGRQFEETAAELRRAAADADWVALGRRSHQLAGACGAIGATGMDALARSVDALARAAAARAAAAVDGAQPVESIDADGIRRRAEHLAVTLEGMLGELRGWLASLPAEPPSAP